jgi:hypothetical protein
MKQNAKLSQYRGVLYEAAILTAIGILDKLNVTLGRR